MDGRMYQGKKIGRESEKKKQEERKEGKGKERQEKK